MKKKPQKNYLDFVPAHIIERFTVNDEGIVTLEIENKGVFNKIAQKLFKKPKISYIHLDEMGSFVWPYIDGQRDITEIGVLVKEHFGDKAEPLYPRLAQYFKTLESYGFIKLDK